MTPAPRIAALDILRGVAVMGILAANLPAFALPEAAYFSPRAWGGTAPADVALWFATYVFVEGKMRALFSILFGASTLLVVERAEAGGRSGAAVHYRRMAWLFVIGCVHLYALWWGDILAHYALCGALAFVFVRCRTRTLLIAAGALVAWQTVQNTGLAYASHRALAHPDAAGRALLAAMNSAFGVPPAADLAAEVAAYRGDYATVFAFRWHHAASPFTFLPIFGAETLASMLIGMAGLKSGFLTGAWPRARYVRWAVVALGIALPAYAAIGIHTIRRGFALDDTVFGALAAAAPLRNVAAIGYAALVILLARSDGWLTARVAAAGRVALTNYLVTSLVMTTLAYGYGLGLFGQVPRAALYVAAPVAWAAMLAWSRPWLANHLYGPLEWLWRSLARWQVAPMHRPADATSRAA